MNITKGKTGRGWRVTTPDVFQMEASECGAACLQMLLKYYRCFVPAEEVREACSVSRNLTAAKQYGLSGKGYSGEIELLYEIKSPCILHWNFNHFVVLEGISKRFAWINDPATGRRRITLEELDEAFTGIVLQVAPGADFKAGGKEASVIASAWEMVRTEKRAIGFLLAANLGLIFAGLLLPVMTQAFVDDVLDTKAYSLLGVVLAGMGFVYFAQIVMTALKDTVLSRLKVKLTLLADKRLFEKLMRLPIPFFEQRFIGELSQREETVNQLYTFAAGAFSDFVLKALQSVIYVLVMLLYSIPLTVISVCGALLCFLFIRLTNRLIQGYALKRTQDQNRLIGMICAGIGVFGSLKAGGAEDSLIAAISGQYAASTKSEQRLSIAQQVLLSVPGIISQMLNVIMLMVGGMLVMRGEMTAGILFAFCQFLAMFLQPVTELLSMQQQIQTLKANHAVMQDLDRAKEDQRYRTEMTASPETVEGRIEADGLYFGYDKSAPPVVTDFRMRLQAGSVAGIVGLSGSGKSTVAKLLSGYLPAWQGSVLIDDCPVSEYPDALLSETVSVVAQKESFFAATVRENLTLWSNRYRDREIFQALSDAEALDLVNTFPGGLDYRLQEDALNLSGGQRQQLAIARALLCNPAVLILDEATSAMDEPREQAIMNNLRHRDCTLIIIAHRLSSVIHADLIMVMDHGVVAECGTHENLLAAGGVYAGLYHTKGT